MMNEDKIGRVMYKLGKLWTLHSKQRFFQLLYNYTKIDSKLFNYEDSAFEKDLDIALKKT